MLLIWLMHFDPRWKFTKSLPFYNYIWIITSLIKILQVFYSNDEQRNFILIIEAVLAIKLQITMNKKRTEKQIHLYREGLKQELSEWMEKKVLWGMTGQTAFIFSLIDLYWIKNDLFILITTLPIIGTLLGFIIIKVFALIVSWAFPLLYIEMKRKKY